MKTFIWLLLFGCLLVDADPLTLAENRQDCLEFHYVKNGETCETIAFGFDLNLTDVQKKYDCDQLVVGDSICVSTTIGCQLRHKVRDGDDCDLLQTVYKINHTSVEHLNPGVSCQNATLTPGKYHCVWGGHDRALARMGCTQFRMLNTSDMGCYDVAEDVGITVDEFRFLNPHLNCSTDTLPSQTNVCIRGHSSVTCSQIDLIDFNKTCNDYYRHYSMSMDQLILLNPTLRCDAIQHSEQICAGVGPFKNTECVETQRVVNSTRTCALQVTMTGLTMDQIKAFNPTVDCTNDLVLSSLICVTWLGMDTRVAQMTIVQSFQDTQQELVEKHLAYRHVRNAENAYALNMHLHSILIQPEVNAQMLDMYDNNDTVATIIDNSFPLPRQVYCDRAMASNTTEEIKSCYCGTDQLLTYCQSLAQQRFQDRGGFNGTDTDYDDTDSDSDSSAYRKFSRIIGSSVADASNPGKRREFEGCEIFDPEDLKSYEDIKDQKFGASCKVPLEIVDIDLDVSFTVPIIEEDNNVITQCTNDGMYCETIMDWDMIGLKRLVDMKAEASCDMCLVGTDWLDFFKKADSGICWEILKLEYTGAVGILDLSTSVNFVLLKITGGMVINVHGMAIPSMCYKSEFQCEEYCKFAYNKYHSTKTSGYMELRLLSILGLPGIKLKEHRFHEPKKMGCEDKKEAAVVVRNGRTCQNTAHNSVSWKCWSDYGDSKSGVLRTFNDFDGVEFQPRTDTRYQCSFTDSFGETKTIDTYGGDSGNIGKSSFFYVFKDQGLYFGRVGYEEQGLVFKWKQSCSTDPSKDISNLQKGLPVPAPKPCTWTPSSNIPPHTATLTFRNERTCKSPKDQQFHIWVDNSHLLHAAAVVDTYLTPWTSVSTMFADHKRSWVPMFVETRWEKVSFSAYDHANKMLSCKCAMEYFFFIRNEGVYFSNKNCPSEQDLTILASFQHPCDDKYANDKLTPTGLTTVPAARCGKNVLGYYTAWGDTEISTSQLHKLTHVVFTHLTLDNDGSIKFGDMNEAGNSTSMIKTIMRWRSLVENARGVYSGIKILIRVGGSADAANFLKVAQNSWNQNNFISTLGNFVTAHGIDGVELGFHTDSLTSSHASLVAAVRSHFGSSKTISVAVPGNADKVDFTALRTVHAYSDIVSVMTTDMHTDNSTGPPSPLFGSNSSEATLTRNIDYIMRKYVCRTGVSGKFHFSLPFYGRIWKNVQHNVNSSSSLYNSGDSGGLVGWKHLERDGFNLDVTEFDEETRLPYIYNNAAKTFLGFENERSILEKISYAANFGHGGLTAWAMDLDDAADTLLDLVASNEELCQPKQSQSYNCDGV